MHIHFTFIKVVAALYEVLIFSNEQQEDKFMNYWTMKYELLSWMRY